MGSGGPCAEPGDGPLVAAVSSNQVGRIDLTPMVVKTMTSQIHNAPKHANVPIKTDHHGLSTLMSRIHEITKLPSPMSCHDANRKNATRQTHKTETNQSKNKHKTNKHSSVVSVMQPHSCAQPAPPARFSNSMAR